MLILVLIRLKNSFDSVNVDWVEKYEIPSLFSIFHTITKWLHTGYTLTILQEEEIFDVFLLYNLCCDAIEEYNKEIDDGSKNKKSDDNVKDSRVMAELYADLREED